jgi:hypothetical protein
MGVRSVLLSFEVASVVGVRFASLGIHPLLAARYTSPLFLILWTTKTHFVLDGLRNASFREHVSRSAPGIVRARLPCTLFVRFNELLFSC